MVGEKLGREREGLSGENEMAGKKRALVGRRERKFNSFLFSNGGVWGQRK